MLTREEIGALERLAGRMTARAQQGVGTAASSGRGRGTELYGHEKWQAGDDLRHLDWNATLRTGTPWVRHFFHEGDVPLRVVLDASRSMDGKWDQARRIAAALAFLARRADRQLAVDVLGKPPSPPTLPNHWHPYVVEQLGERGGDGSLLIALAALRKLPARREQLVIVTDFADPTPPKELCDAVARLSRGRSVDVVHLVEDDDRVLPAAVAIRSPESDAVRFVAPDVRDGFARRIANWQHQVQDCAQQSGLSFRRVDVTAPFDVVGPVSDMVVAWS